MQPVSLEFVITPRVGVGQVRGNVTASGSFQGQLAWLWITVELRGYIALKHGVSTAVFAVREKLFKLSLRLNRIPE